MVVSLEDLRTDNLLNAMVDQWDKILYSQYTCSLEFFNASKSINISNTPKHDVTALSDSISLTLTSAYTYAYASFRQDSIIPTNLNTFIIYPCHHYFHQPPVRLNNPVVYSSGCTMHRGLNSNAVSRCQYQYCAPMVSHHVDLHWKRCEDHFSPLSVTSGPRFSFWSRLL
jgi:hypothetical protein